LRLNLNTRTSPFMVVDHFFQHSKLKFQVVNNIFHLVTFVTIFLRLADAELAYSKEIKGAFGWAAAFPNCCGLCLLKKLLWAVA